jgi:hypothetical protein
MILLPHPYDGADSWISPPHHPLLYNKISSSSRTVEEFDFLTPTTEGQLCAKREREKVVDHEQQQDETNSVTTLPGKDERRGRGDPKLAQRPCGN